MRIRFGFSFVLSVFFLFASGTSEGEETLWSAKAPSTAFVADWSNADAVDREASAYFLTHVWPRIRQASVALHSKLTITQDASYTGPLSDSEAQAGLISFIQPIETVVPWYLIPTSEQAAQRTITTFAALGQSEAVGIAVHALKNVDKIRVVSGDLIGPGRIPASVITSRLSLSYAVNPRGKGNVLVRQMLLLNVKHWDIPESHTYEWIIDVHVPEDTVPGLYSGPIYVQVAGETISTFHLNLEVLPFTLQDNGCRWGAFMTPNPAHATEAWCNLNARYGFNTLAWWKLDDPALSWTWEGRKSGLRILAKLRDESDNALQGEELSRSIEHFPEWLRRRFQAPFLEFTADEIEGYWTDGQLLPLPDDLTPDSPAYKRPLQLYASVGDVPDELATLIRFDRPAQNSRFEEPSIHSVSFRHDEAFQQFDAGMQRLRKYGFTGPLTWFSAGSTSPPWEQRIIAQRFGPRYRTQNWQWLPEVTAENSNHLWYLANAAVAKSFSEAPQKYGWPEVVWCPQDESLDAKGQSGRRVANMIGEMMPYIKNFAPHARMYAVVWHTKEDNWKGMWQAGVLQKFATTTNAQGEQKPSLRYGPFHVICTNCPNDLDREVTWAAGGEYWLYDLITSTAKPFLYNRFAFGFHGARHYGAVFYSYADSSRPQNLSPNTDVARSSWLTGAETLNYYLTKEPGSSRIDYALASHAMLACREGILDRKYVETLRILAYEYHDAESLKFLHNLPARIQELELSDMSGDVRIFDDLRYDIAMRITALVTQ